MYCAHCGLQVDDGANFCRACGQSLTPTPPPVPGAAGIPGAALGAIAQPANYGGFWVRFAAYLIDGVILGIPYFFVLLMILARLGALRRRFIPFGGRGGYGDEPFSGGVFPPAAGVFLGIIVVRILFLMAIFLVLHWLYFAGMESSEREATLGKSLMSLRVTDLEGRRLSFKHATGRFFAKIITSLIPLGIGYILAGFTAKKQALHDMIAGTLVLRR